MTQLFSFNLSKKDERGDYKEEWNALKDPTTLQRPSDVKAKSSCKPSQSNINCVKNVDKMSLKKNFYLPWLLIKIFLGD